MSYTMARDGDALTLTIWGPLDINSSPVLESALDKELDDILDFTLDFAHVTNVSSMGLRLLLYWQKCMFKQGSMHIDNVSPEVMELFTETGFSQIFDIR